MFAHRKISKPLLAGLRIARAQAGKRITVLRFCGMATSSISEHSQLPHEMELYFTKTKEKYQQLNLKLMGDIASSELAQTAKELSDIGKTMELIDQREQLLQAIADLDKMALEEQAK